MEKLEKKLDKINLEDLPEYIWLFTHLFNKKKFEKLLEHHKWDHKINLTNDAPNKLNVKAYTMTIKEECHMQFYLPRNYIPVVILIPNYTSLPSMAATFLATCLMAVLQPSGYSIFYRGDTPIQLSLLWQSYTCQCLNTETSARSNRDFITETLSIFYNIHLYIRLVVIL